MKINEETFDKIDYQLEKLELIGNEIRNVILDCSDYQGSFYLKKSDINKYNKKIDKLINNANILKNFFKEYE